MMYAKSDITHISNMHTNSIDIKTVRGVDCNSHHYLVKVRFRERLSVINSNKDMYESQNSNLKTWKIMIYEQNIKIQNRFKVLESKYQSEGLHEKDVETAWETIRNCIKLSASESLG